MPGAIERDERDAGAVHVVAVRDGTVVGTGRLFADGSVAMVGRMAVLPSVRGLGVGAALLVALEGEAFAAGLASVQLHAQLTARGFYLRSGYTTVGSTYLEAGIEHATMAKPMPVLREVSDDDSAALIELISACWAEYPGCVMDVDGEEPWLRAPATAYRDWGATMWVVTLAGSLVACVGLKPLGDSAELKSLYVGRAARRRGLGERLTLLVEREARGLGCRRVELWSDTRFADAHRLYERLGYRRLPEVRELHDRSATVEYHYDKSL